MVLENASDTVNQDSFSDAAPPSDFDPYSGSDGGAGGAGGARIPATMDGLPQPFPILGTLQGWPESWQKLTQARVQHATTVLKRPVNQAEVDAFSFWTARQVSIISYGTPIGVAGGLWRTYSTRASMRIPFFQPKVETTNFEIFPHPKMAIARGSRAILAWHIMRGVAYSSMGIILGQIFFGSYSMSVTAVGEMGDPRLKEFTDALRKQAQQNRGALPQPRSRIPSPPPKQSEVDDASPTGGMYMSEEATQPVEEPQTQWSAPAPPNPRTTQMQPLEQESRGQAFDYFDDDSPTSGQGMAADTSSRPQAASGSAWDPPAQAATQGGWQARRNQQSGDNSFSFSKGEEEKNYAKEEAQKEFDARVERERKGEDFSSGGGSAKRW
ncbi:hypothetical protein B0J14DRAFT_615307 [Halenospora varia]|nr:hypothetical protein B0J14DRAFT_615307 [Halenospora varia]